MSDEEINQLRYIIARLTDIADSQRPAHLSRSFAYTISDLIEDRDALTALIAQIGNANA